MPIMYWNEVALEANKADFSYDPPLGPEQGGPTLSSRALAIVHLAMYEAYATASGNPAGLEHYLLAPEPLPPGGVDAAAAVAGAAHATLSALYPRQQSIFDHRLAASGFGGMLRASAGVVFGRKVADRLLSLRSGDPVSGGPAMVPAGKPNHKADPQPPKEANHGALFGLAKPFASSNALALAAPPYAGGADPDYVKALRQVRYKGIMPELSATVPSAQRRTPDQTMTGVYWGYDGANGLGTPPRLYNQIIRQVVIERGLTVPQQARLFALVNTAMGDAGILAWREKYRYNFWRPVVGIREHGASMGAEAGAVAGSVSADCDSNWLPFGAPRSNRSATTNFTPPFPAYPSGHATFGAAAFGVARHYLEGLATNNPAALHPEGADAFFPGGFVSDEFNGKTTDSHGVVRPRHLRKFDDGLWAMIIENGLSRVFLGVHWVFDAYAVHSNGSPDLSKNIGGVRLGLDIAASIITGGLTQKP